MLTTNDEEYTEILTEMGVTKAIVRLHFNKK
jgi:hypothetical protein